MPKPNDESQPQVPEPQPARLAVNAEDETERLKVLEATKEASTRRSSTENNGHPAASTEKDTTDKSRKLSIDVTDSKTESSHVAPDKPEENGESSDKINISKYIP